MINQNSTAQIKEGLQEFDLHVTNILIALASIAEEKRPFNKEETLEFKEWIQEARNNSDFILSQLTEIVASSDEHKHIPSVQIPNFDNIMDDILEKENY